MPIVSAGILEGWVTEMFRKCGARDEDARVVARSLVESNLVGHDSHGVLQAPRYCREVQEGRIRVQSEPAIVRESATTAVMDAQWGFGQVTAFRALGLALDKASQHDLGCVTVRQSNHIGRLGEYAWRAAEQGFIGLVMINGHGVGRQVAPFGGSDGRLATNPLAIGIPPIGGQGLLLDMTTSVVAQGKIDLLQARGKRLPEGWILDGFGLPSTDPAAFQGPPPGTLLPLGGNTGYKGFGLSMMVEVLAGALSGAGCSRTREGDILNAVFILALRVDAFVDQQEFGQQVSELIRHVKASPLRPGFTEILVPGEVESRSRQARLESGIDIETPTWKRLCEWAQKLGIRIPEGLS
ncbi:MAG: Ldh family oxidoreductase [Planctomycetes bacterium]|nr:Ldh family oxidoreductase [Planctomycetota bacterium]